MAESDELPEPDDGDDDLEQVLSAIRGSRVRARIRLPDGAQLLVEGWGRWAVLEAEPAFGRRTLHVGISADADLASDIVVLNVPDYALEAMQHELNMGERAELRYEIANASVELELGGGP